MRIRRSRITDPDRRKRFGVLLGAIVAAFAIQGIAEPGRWEQVIISVLLAATLLLSLRVAEARPALIRVAEVVVAMLILASLVDAIVGNSNGLPARIANLLLVALAPPAIVIGIIRTLRTRGQVTIEAVFGVLCLYLLIGMFFAFLYGAIGKVDDGFFAQDVSTTVSRCLYFSFTTLTTVGYGDLTAKSNLGHTLSMSEALVGQIYLVTVVSVIVGNLGRARPSRGGRADEAP